MVNNIISINDSVTLVKTPIHYIIQFKYSAYHLIQSIVKSRIIPGVSTDEKYRTLTFKARSVNSLVDIALPLSISTVARMIPFVARQLNHLLCVHSQTIYGLATTDFIIINDTIPVFLGNDWVISLDSERRNMAMISCPYVPTEGFFSPEVLHIRELPTFIHYKSAYASLGLWLVYLLVGNDSFYQEYIHHKQISRCLDVLQKHPIYQTRLYAFLSRCLVEEPAERCLFLL